MQSRLLESNWGAAATFIDPGREHVLLSHQPREEPADRRRADGKAGEVRVVGGVRGLKRAQLYARYSAA